MTIAEQLRELESVLGAWASELGGKAFVAPDLRRFWNMAYESSDTPRVVIVWYGEALRGAFPVAAALGRVDRQFLVAFTRGRGLNSDLGDSLTTDIGNATAFTTLYEQLRDLIRSIINLSVERPIDFKDAQTAQQVTSVLDGVVLRFSTANDLPLIVLDPSADADQICSWTVEGESVVPSLGGSTSYFNSGGDIAAGSYRVTYISGALQYAAGPWQLNDAPDSFYKIVYSGGMQVAGPGDSATYASQALVEAANAGTYVEFTHTGGPIGVYLNSPPVSPVAGSPNPTFLLTTLVCVSTINADSSPS